MNQVGRDDSSFIALGWLTCRGIWPSTISILSQPSLSYNALIYRFKTPPKRTTKLNTKHIKSCVEVGGHMSKEMVIPHMAIVLAGRFKRM